MQFSNPLILGRLERRYKRFFADIMLDKEVVVAHVPNTGSLKGCLQAGQDCLISPATQPERKLRYTLEMIKGPKSWIGVNTGLPNKLVKELFDSRTLTHWNKWPNLQLEVKIDKETRMDGALFNPKNAKDADRRLTPADFKTQKLHFLEFKNVTMAEGNTAYFPDAVTERGQKHLKTLMQFVKDGHQAEIVFVIQRSDVSQFSPAKDIDPEYAKLLLQAKEAGVLITPIACKINETEIRLDPSKILEVVF